MKGSNPQGTTARRPNERSHDSRRPLISVDADILSSDNKRLPVRKRTCVKLRISSELISHSTRNTEGSGMKTEERVTDLIGESNNGRCIGPMI